MKNIVPILEILRSRGKRQQVNARMGNVSPCASLSAGITFLLSLYPPLPVCRPPLPIEENPSPMVKPKLLVSLHEDSFHDTCQVTPVPTGLPSSDPAKDSTTYLQPSCYFIYPFPQPTSSAPPAPLSGSGCPLLHPLPTGHQWAVTQGCVGPPSSLLKLEPAWGARECYILKSGDWVYWLLPWTLPHSNKGPQDVLSCPKLYSYFTQAFLFYFNAGNLSAFSSLKCDFSFPLNSLPPPAPPFFFFFWPQYCNFSFEMKVGGMTMTSLAEMSWLSGPGVGKRLL